MQTVGIVSPGSMGSAMAGVLIRGGARVVATLDGRSERTARLAEGLGIELLPDLESVVDASAVLLSIAPPEAALEIGENVAAAARLRDARPLVADLNAIAPTTARRLETIVQTAGCDFVDGSISGPPPSKPGTTRVYLSSLRAPEIAGLPFDRVERIVVGDRIGDASAVKMGTASVYKGTTAVLTHACRGVRSEGGPPRNLGRFRIRHPPPLRGELLLPPRVDLEERERALGDGLGEGRRLGGVVQPVADRGDAPPDLLCVGARSGQP